MTKADLTKSYVPITAVVAAIVLVFAAGTAWAADRSMVYANRDLLSDHESRIRTLERAQATQDEILRILRDLQKKSDSKP